MKQKAEIGKRIKELRKKNKYSQSYVAKTLFISQAAYSLIENAQNGLVADHIVGLSNLYEVTTDYILKGGNHLIKTSPSQDFIPFYKVKAHAGYVNNFSGDLDLVETEFYKIPGYKSTVDHRLFEVEGTSMVPTILPGDILICEKHKNFNDLKDGSVLLIVTKTSLLVSRLRENNKSDFILFEHDNSEEAEILKFNKDEITEIHLVKGKITSFPSYIPSFIVDNEKFRSLEESVELLRKELIKVSKKLKS